MKTVAISQILWHENGTCILGICIKFRMGRYTFRYLEYKFDITVTKAGV